MHRSSDYADAEGLLYMKGWMLETTLYCFIMASYQQ